MISLKFPFRLISKDNDCTINRYTKRKILSPKFRAFEEQVKLFAKQQYKEAPIRGDLKVCIVACYKTKVHCDLFNSPKGCIDALQGIVIENDRQIKVGKIAVAEGMAADKFEVDIEVIE